MKKYLYLFMAVGAAIFFAYVVGGRVGYEKCRADDAVKSEQIQLNLVKVQEDVNEVVLRTGVGDIRRILREKYTIAQ